MESANFQAANIENASSQENSEFAHQLTTPTFSEEDQANFTSDKRQQCTHCSNQPDHRPRTPQRPAFRKTCSQCGILHHFGRVCMKRTTNPGHPKGKQAEISKVRYVCYSVQMRMKVIRHFNSTLPKRSQISRLPSRAPPSKFALILVLQRTPSTTQHMRPSVLEKKSTLKTHKCKTSPVWRR